MSIVGIICLSAIVIAFLVFAAVLAWGDHQTRNITRPTKQRQRQATQAGVEALKDAAAEAREPIHAA